MTFFQKLLALMDTSMPTPTLYGWFHLLCLGLMVAGTVVLCLTHKKGDESRVRRVILIVSVVVAVLELYKQINYSFSYENGIVFDFQWYAFPWQFCSTPMYVGLLAGITKKGRFHDCLCAFLATYAIFAGLSVMVYPGDVFISTIGVNIQTMICHGSMITVGIYLFYTGYVKLSHKTILKALPVFAAALGIAVVANEIAYYTGLLETETFNMFFVSRHCDPSLPVYSIVQAHVSYPYCLIIYIIGFTLAAYIILLAAMAIARLAGKKKKLPVA